MKREEREEFEKELKEDRVTATECMAYMSGDIIRVNPDMRDLYFKANGTYGSDAEVYYWYYKNKSISYKKPAQYDIGIDTFERMKANCSLEEIIGGCKLNIDKYVWRKKGCDKEDLVKARDYIDLWIWALENKK